jgi:SAM-dependent methyltransferase
MNVGATPNPTGDQFEAKEAFSSRDSWLDFRSRNAWISSTSHMRDMANYAKEHGVTSDFLGYIPPDSISILNENYREAFIAAGFNSRQRTILDLAYEVLSGRPRDEPRIFAHEALSDFALFFRGRYPFFIGSEYAETKAEEARLFPIQCVDITRSPFPDEIFDLVLSCEVLEHVSDLEAALRDTARILRRGGLLLATVPFDFDTYDMLVKATIVDGEIAYLTDPEYHGNPIDPQKGSLVFQIPGWSLLDLCRSTGFSTAEMVFWASRKRGFVATKAAGVFVLRAVR